MPKVIIYTDGACLNNPGPGGYGAVLLWGKHRREISGGFQWTTNNRMELLAVIEALTSLKKECEVQLWSDSRYVVENINQGYVFRWKQNHWMQANKRAANVDLWERLLPLLERHNVEFCWVKGHAGVEENERCDQLASQAARSEDLQEDEGYTEEEPASLQTEHVSGSPERKRKVKITKEGQPCRKCSTPVVKRTPKRKEMKPGQEYYFAYYLYSPHCKAMYMQEDAKVRLAKQEGLFS